MNDYNNYGKIDKIIYIRREYNEFEYRTPIVPSDINNLIHMGFVVYVQTSKHRFFLDNEYKENGAIITEKYWYDDLVFNNALIIGLKEIEDLHKLSHHRHLYFSHSYKGQTNCQEILSAFMKSSSIIYDFEYFVDNVNKRVISFGFYAGIVGCILGLLQYLKKHNSDSNISTPSTVVSGVQCLQNISYWDTIDDVMTYFIQNIDIISQLNISIVGANGNTGSGVKHILDKLKIKYEIFNKTSDKSNLKNSDILYNCICLHNTSTEIWFDKNTCFTKPIIISDISCDYSQSNNPIQLYDKNTTWKNPVYSYNKYVDIIAINNLPSLLPRESSIYFSSKCVELLRNLDGDTNDYWKNNEKVFFDKLRAV